MESTIRDLFRNLEQTLHERLLVIEEVLVRAPRGNVPVYEQGRSGQSDQSEQLYELTERIESLTRSIARLGDRMNQMEIDVEKAREQALEALKSKNAAPAVPVAASLELLPSKPMKGLEVTIPEVVAAKIVQVVVPPAPEETSEIVEVEEAEEAVEAVEAEESVAADETEELEEEAVTEEVEEVDAEETVEVVEEAVTEEVVEEEAVAQEVVEEAEEAEEAEEGLELEEFEYKGKTYYRDNDNNVYAGEDGDIDVENPIGTWNALKQRILPRK